jgi:hypothetical protein
LAGGINIKDNVMTPLSIPQPPNGLLRPAIAEAMLLEQGAERFHTRTIDIGEASGSDWIGEADICVQTAP